MGGHACRWARWKQKIQDDSETNNWLAANTKPCPKCGKPVEKNGGCNLVVCKCRQVHLVHIHTLLSSCPTQVAPWSRVSWLVPRAPDKSD